MKNFLKFLGIVVLVSAIGFSMLSCDDDADGNGGGGAGRLTITNLPSGARVEGVFVTANTSESLIGFSIAMASPIALAQNSSSPFDIYSASAPYGPWTGSGSYAVIIMFDNQSFDAIRSNVSFSNGYATLNYNSMVRVF